MRRGKNATLASCFKNCRSSLRQVTRGRPSCGNAARPYFAEPMPILLPRTIVLAVGLGLAVSASAPAQPAPPARPQSASELRGMVWDSLANRGLEGARVLAVASSDRAALHETQADSNGEFAFRDLKTDRYLVTFAHPRLDSLRLIASQASIDLRAGLPQQLDLAIPSAATVYRLHCGTSPVDTLETGVMVGRVAVTPLSPPPVLPDTVRGQWRALALDDAQLAVRTFESSAPIGAQGEFVLCGLPGGGEVDVQVLTRSQPSRSLAFDVPVHGVLARDLLIPQTRNSAGALDDGCGGSCLVELRGRVIDRAGAPVADATLYDAESGARTRTDSLGAFLFPQRPLGTQNVHVRRLGFTPRRFAVDVVAGDSADIVLRMDRHPTALAAVVVRDRRSFAGFEQRRAQTTRGVFLDEAMIAAKRPLSVANLLHGLPGVAVSSSLGSRSTIVTRFGIRRCTPSVFLDGRPILADTEDLDAFIEPRQLRGVEVYAFPAEVPREFLGNPFCGAILFWSAP